MRNITKIKRSTKAISPVIATLLLIAIVVVASIVAYAWVMGFLGFQTERTDNQIQIQSYTYSGNLILYIQNTGQGTVNLKQDSSVYINDILKEIINVNDQAVAPGDLIPIAESQTIKIEINYKNFQPGDKIKIVTVEGTTIENSGNNNGSGNSNGGGTSNTYPTARFSFTPTSPTVDQTITFTDQSVAGSATINQWSWNFGATATPSSSATRNPIASFSSIGDKTVTLTVTDSDGKTSTSSKTFRVENTASSQAPTAEFTISTTNPALNQNVVFTDTSTANSGTITQWSWNFGDGATSTLQNPVHSYSTSGEKTINLVVTDSNSKSASVTHTLTVSDTEVNPTPNPNTYQVTFGVSPSGSGTVSPSGTNSYSAGSSVPIVATPNSGYTFSSWTFTGSIQITNPNSASTNAVINGAGTITANFITSSTNKLAFSTINPANRVLISGQPAQLAVQRQTSSGSPTTNGGSITVNLGATVGNFYSDPACTIQITNIGISNGQSTSSTFYFKASTAGPSTITASATNYQPISTTFTVNAASQTTILSSNFDGTNWAEGWSFWSNPPWGSTTQEFLSSPRSIYSNSGNQGPFSCDKINAQGATYVTVDFDFKLQSTEASDFQLRYSGTRSDNYDSVVWSVASNTLGDRSQYSASWNHVTLTITATSAFTDYFRIQFLSSLNSGEAVYVDNVVIAIHY